MKFSYQVALASLASILIGFAPASAYAMKSDAAVRSHSQTYHDRTPKVHTRTTSTHRR